MNDFQYWRSITAPKCSITCYNQRIIRGAKREDATYPVHILLISNDGRECRHCNNFKPWQEYAPQLGKEHDRKSICKQCARDVYNAKKERESVKREKPGVSTKQLPTKSDETTKQLDDIYENSPTVKNNRAILGIQSPNKEFVSKIQYLQASGYHWAFLSEAYGVTIMPDY